MNFSSLSLLLVLLNVENVTSFGFNFSNLLFFLHAPGAKPHCKGPLAPHHFCDKTCNALASSSRKLLEDSDENLTWTESACYAIKHHPWYSTCMEGAIEACDMDADAEYAEADAEYADAVYAEGNYNGGANSSNSTPITSRISYLPYAIAAAVATMFVGLYVWKKKRDERQLQSEDLLADDDSFHGSVARRLEKGTISPSPSNVEPKFVKASTVGYALA